MRKIIITISVTCIITISVTCIVICLVIGFSLDKPITKEDYATLQAKVNRDSIYLLRKDSIIRRLKSQIPATVATVPEVKYYRSADLGLPAGGVYDFLPRDGDDKDGDPSWAKTGRHGKYYVIIRGDDGRLSINEVQYKVYWALYKKDVVR